MIEAMYFCCALISTLCAFLLAKSYWRGRGRILLWVSVSFGFLALNNIFAIVDLVLLPDFDLNGSLVRNILFATAGTSLLFGLIWEAS
jgi:hypothetical protein